MKLNGAQSFPRHRGLRAWGRQLSDRHRLGSQEHRRVLRSTWKRTMVSWT